MNRVNLHQVVAVLSGLAALVNTPRLASSEPYLSIRTGQRCSQCHVNRTGGGGRTDFGNIYAQTRLPLQQSNFRGRSISDLISLSANLRTVGSGTFADETPRASIDLEEANLQIEARVVPDILALYVDETLGPSGAMSREAFALIENLPLNGYLKAGKMLLPYGLRLVDDREYIRERTGFTFDTPDLGVEVGLEPGPLSLFVSVSNGTQGATEEDSGKQVTGTAALTLPHLRLGASASRNDAVDGLREVIGAFGGFNLGRFTLLGELDAISDELPGGVRTEQLAAYLEGNFLITRGINTKVTYGFLDPNRNIGENARVRMRFGAEIFPVSFLQLSSFYVLLDDIPQATTDLDRWRAELHVFF